MSGLAWLTAFRRDDLPAFGRPCRGQHRSGMVNVITRCLSKAFVSKGVGAVSCRFSREPVQINLGQPPMKIVRHCIDWSWTMTEGSRFWDNESSGLNPLVGSVGCIKSLTFRSKGPLSNQQAHHKPQICNDPECQLQLHFLPRRPH